MSFLFCDRSKRSNLLKFNTGYGPPHCWPEASRVAAAPRPQAKSVNTALWERLGFQVFLR